MDSLHIAIPEHLKLNKPAGHIGTGAYRIAVYTDATIEPDTIVLRWVDANGCAQRTEFKVAAAGRDGGETS